MPKGVRLKPEQIVAKLREIEVKIGQGKDVPTACREAGATDKSYYRWPREYGGMKVDQAKRLKQLEWAVPGFKDTLLRCLMEPEVFDGATQEVF